MGMNRTSEEGLAGCMISRFGILEILAGSPSIDSELLMGSFELLMGSFELLMGSCELLKGSCELLKGSCELLSSRTPKNKSRQRGSGACCPKLFSCAERGDKVGFIERNKKETWVLSEDA